MPGPGPFRVHMFFNGPGNGWWIDSTILMVLFWAAIILIVLALFRHYGGHQHAHAPAAPADQAALDVLKMRLAKGEITEEEYKSRSDLLQAPR
ncbi:MAG: SHOCT domain-containing protein [Acidimicrobiales bacterium]